MIGYETTALVFMNCDHTEHNPKCIVCVSDTDNFEFINRITVLAKYDDGSEGVLVNYPDGTWHFHDNNAGYRIRRPCLPANDRL